MRRREADAKSADVQSRVEAGREHCRRAEFVPSWGDFLRFFLLTVHRGRPFRSPRGVLRIAENPRKLPRGQALLPSVAVTSGGRRWWAAWDSNPRPPA